MEAMGGSDVSMHVHALPSVQECVWGRSLRGSGEWSVGGGKVWGAEGSRGDGESESVWLKVQREGSVGCASHSTA
eukprot:54781-Eustigmatos_ZCMA.PRE.1